MDEPVCDLVLLSWNHLEETQPCLESLLDATRVPCRLLIVDNGSEPDVQAFLQAVKPRGAIQEVVVLQNQTNEGFPRGMNRGIQSSRAPYVCLLNNDLRFTTGWLQEMIDVASANPRVGVINPTSSTFGNYPPKGMALQLYADSLKWSSRGRYVEVGMCIGFCMLVKREVIERIGGFSEEVERIFFEDEDFSMRAQAAGYQCVVAEASYVYHAEHQTVRAMPEREALFTRNQQWCHAKWGPWLRVAYPRFDRLLLGSPELRAWLEQLIALARNRTHVYVYCPTPRQVSRNELFRSVGLVPHADILWHSIPARGARLTAALTILKRQKKRFTAILAPDRAWARGMRWLRPLHRARVIPVEDRHTLVERWKTQQRPSTPI